MMDESSFVKTPLGEQFQSIKKATKEVVMTTVRSISSRDPTQTDLIRYFDRALAAPDPVRAIDRFAIEAKARRERAAVMSEMVGGGIAWLWQRVTHLGDTRSPPANFHVESRVQF